MSATSTIAMLAFMLAAIACRLSERNGRRAVTIAVSIVMVLAMVDVMVTGVLPGLLWAAVLFCTGLVEAVRYRRGPTGRGGHDRIAAYHAASHTGMAAVIVAHTLAQATNAGDHGTAAGGATGHHHGSSTFTIGPETLVLALATVLALTGIAITVLEVRKSAAPSTYHRTRLPVFEPALMGASILAMAF